MIMKKLNILFAILIAVLGVTTLKAQTDVTSTYLTNADFEGSYKSLYKVNSNRHIYQPEGWTVDYKNESTNNMTVLENTDAQASNFSGTYAIPDNTKRYMVRFRDNKPKEYIDLSQTITIQETGKYTFSAEMIREDGSKVDVSLYVGETSVSNANPGVWENRSFAIILSAGDVVKVGLKFRNIAAGGNKLGADNVKIAFEPINTSEQSWIAPVVGVNLKDVNNNTELYMYNVKADAFAASGMAWGTHAIVKELQNGDSKLSADVHRCRVSKPTDGQLQIMLNERSFLGGGGPTSTNDCWVDHGSNNVYIYNEVSTNVYTLKPTTATNDSYLDCSWKYGGHITFSATNGYGNTEWAFVLRSDITSGKYLLYKAKKEMYDIYAAVKEAGHDDTYAEALSIAYVAYNDANATAATVTAATKVLLAKVAPALTSGYFSANSLFKNPDMRGYGDDTDWGNGLNAFGDGIFESWHSSETITQKQTGLPNGFYTVEFIGIYRQDGGDAAPTLTLTSGSNSAKANLKALTEIDFGNCSGGNKWTDKNKPDDKYSAGEALAHTDANVKVENFFVENGELTVTVAMPSGSQWLLCQGFRISFKAESLEQYANLFKEAKAAAEAIDPEALSAYAASELSTALSNAANEQVDKDWYQARTAELNEAVALANAVVTPYANAKALFSICENILNNSQEFVDGAETTFLSALNTAKTEVEAATTADAVNAIYNTLETARQIYVQKADPLNGVAFDYTFLVVNPGLDEGTNGWTSTGDAQNKNIATNKTNGIITGAFFENWNPSNFTGEIYQTISNLPSGVYKLKVAAYGTGTNVYANDKQTAVTTSDGAWYEVDQVKVGDGTLKFGIKNENATTWMGIDNASLEYYGFDVATAQTGITTLKAEAEDLVGKPMSVEVATALDEAITGADATKTTRNELNSMIEALSKAIADAETSIAEYAQIKTYIDKADKIDASIAASYKAQYDNRTLSEPAVDVFKNLEVATYKYVTDEFSYPVELSSAWNTEGPVGELSDQHWSGEKRPYMEQSSAAWGSNAWEISYDQDLTLPAGEYVFKVAGRKASGNGCTLELIVTKGDETLGTVNDFPEGDTGYGIDTSGAANFSDEGEYANNDKGRAWQWRYVKFTLGEAATVNIAVKAKATTNHQWISFCDATVQMTEETYLEANMGGLDAPTAAANALVDTKPMGTAENTALQTALDMSVNTGAELQAKINALNNAVVKANAWVVAYNEAKTPLVAALERFETDYNKDGVKMSQTVWNNVLEKVKAAALAKDVTDRYDGFEAAANNLNTALDEADKSIEAYATLNAAIEQAETLASANVGDQPFQRPVSAQNTLNAAITVAQAAYDAAEDDATGVKSTLDKAVEAFNNAELNKPEADEAFNIVLVYANYEFDGKAMTYIANDRKDHGLYNIKYKTEPNANYAQAFTLTPITDKVNHYTLSMTDVDGNERYVCTGTVYGGNASQIRTTTDASKALAVKVIATSTDDIWNLQNTEAEQYIGSQDEGVYTVNSHIDFNIVKAEKADVTLNISSAGWATLILPFNAEIPEGVTVYASESVEGELVKLTEVGSIVANTPYLIKGTAGEYNFYGYGLADKNEYKDANELFVGTYVDYKTEGGEYVLQNHKGKVAFYRVGDEKPTVKAYRCYLTASANEAKAFFFGNEATGINGVDTAGAEIEAIYTINGTKVNNLQKGLNIVKMSNGKTQKVYVK